MIRALSLIALLLLSGGCYATRMALHHNELFNTRRPVSAVLADPATPQKQREQLQLVAEIMHFAAAEGLNTHGAYRYIIDTKDPVVSYIVQAAHADRLESVTWWFPFIGAVPYRGYFKKSERDTMADDLRAQGFDVDIGAATAFSSLGWFEDPLFTSMLNRSESDLAHLLFHELTHRTFWAPGSTRFNENLAEYVGEELTVKYLVAKRDAAAVKSYEEKRADRRLFHDWLTTLRSDLESYYARSAEQKLPRAQVLTGKSELIERYQRRPLKPPFKILDYVGDETWNNATILASGLYSPDTKSFARAHACLRNQAMSAFLDALREATDATGDPFIALDSLCIAS